MEMCLQYMMIKASQMRREKIEGQKVTKTERMRLQRNQSRNWGVRDGDNGRRFVRF